MSVTDQTFKVAGVPNYLARAAKATTAGILLIPHVVGIDHFTTDFAHGLAERGYTTLVWNPYPDLAFGTGFEDGKRPPRPKDAASLQTFAACVDAMGSELGLKAIAALGFCMGGRFGLMFGAREPRLRAVVAAYPSLPAELVPGQDIDPRPTLTANITCPVQVLYPGKDIVTQRATFEKLQSSLHSRTAPTSILVYPEAEHGFMHTPGPTNDAATRAALPQVYGFLEAYLGA